MLLSLILGSFMCVFSNDESFLFFIYGYHNNNQIVMSLMTTDSYIES